MIFDLARFRKTNHPSLLKLNGHFPNSGKWFEQLSQNFESLKREMLDFISSPSIRSTGALATKLTTFGSLAAQCCALPNYETRAAQNLQEVESSWFMTHLRGQNKAEYGGIAAE